MKWFAVAWMWVVFAAPAYAQIGPGQPVGEGAWRIDIARDVMTDYARSTAFIVNEEQSAGLLVQCQGGRTNHVYFAFEFTDYIGGIDQPVRTALVRFDRDPPLTIQMRHDQDTLQVRDQRSVAILVSRLRSATSVAVRVVTEESDRTVPILDASFNVTGSLTAVDAAYAACGQPLPP